MKHFIIPASLILLISISACSGEKTVADPDRENAVRVSNLLNYLKTLPRISVQGYGYNATVTYSNGRGAPLFVIDDIVIGNDFRQVTQLLDPNEYVTIRQLSANISTIRYGKRGGGGALLINRIEKYN